MSRALRIGARGSRLAPAPAGNGTGPLSAALADGPVAVTFTSPSTVAAVWGCLEAAAGAEVLGRILPISIGPVTSQALRERGIAPEVEADPHTAAGLLEAVREWGCVRPPRSSGNRRSRR